MKLAKIIVGFLILAVNLYATSLIVTSDVISNTAWDVDTVFINKEFFEVKENARLSIAAGVHVIFKKNIAVITVKGTITAIGTATDSIYFKREDNGKWQGIRILSKTNDFTNQDSSFLEYCNFQKAIYLGTQYDYEQQGGVLYCGKGNFVLLKNSLISDVMGLTGGAVYADSGSTVRIEKCSFLRNIAEGDRGGAVTTSNGGTVNLRVQNCSFKYNCARTGGAVCIGKGTIAELNNCVFYKDTTTSVNPALNDLNGGAIAIFGSSNVTMRNCIIFHCRSYLRGGAIYCEDASPKIINCTIARNSTIYGGGIYFARAAVASSPLLINTIVDGNGKLFGVSIPRDSAGCGIFLDSSVTPVFRHCQMYDTVYDYTIKPYTGEFTNSRYCKTGFVYETPGYDISDTLVDGYNLFIFLSKKDPGIDSGTPDTIGLGLPEFDVAGRKRINGTTVDIGALEFHEDFSSINPCAHHRKTEQSLISGSELAIYSLNGQKLGIYNTYVSLQTVKQFIQSRFPHGVYLVTLNGAGKQIWSRKVMVK